MHISVIAVGKIKENYLKEGIAEYSKRLGRYCRFDITEVSAEKDPESLGKREEDMVREKEGKGIIAHLSGGAHKIALCIDGRDMSSVQLSSYIQRLGVNGVSGIQFVIGGSLGLSDEVVSKCDMKLSFSKMTFPHQLMRLILLEQVYRCFKIMNNETYHK